MIPPPPQLFVNFLSSICYPLLWALSCLTIIQYQSYTFEAYPFSSVNTNGIESTITYIYTYMHVYIYYYSICGFCILPQHPWLSTWTQYYTTLTNTNLITTHHYPHTTAQYNTWHYHRALHHLTSHYHTIPLYHNLPHVTCKSSLALSHS